ncbi:MAG: hypothetical protein VST68_03290 [Nitrospirota bacterium]|nr:hypothetical protein [Nitrospirota bacterium]
MMSQGEPPNKHVHTTETFLRFYVLLSQYLDRCWDQNVRLALPEAEFATHLEETRQSVETLFASNRRGPSKVHAEYEQVMQVGTAFMKAQGAESEQSALEHERDRLRMKTSVLSDLMAVFRSM